MTITETYDLFNQLRMLDLRIKEGEHKANSIRSRLYYPAAIRYDKDRVQSSPSDSLADAESLIADIDTQTLELRLKRDKLLKIIISGIDMLDNEEERLVLTCYYLDKERMEKIAEAIPCSRRTIYRIRRRAVKNLSNVM